MGRARSAAAPGRRWHIARPGAALAVGILTVAVLVSAVIVVSIAKQRVTLGNIGEAAVFGSFAVVGMIVAWHQPRNPMGWVLLGIPLFFFLDNLGGSYAYLDYRLHGGRLPLGALAVLVTPSWAPAIVLAGLCLLLFPDGRIPSGRWKPVLYVYLGVAAAWLAGAYILALGDILGGHVRIDSTDGLTNLDNPTGPAAWFGQIQDVFFFVVAVCWLAWLAGQVVAYRHARGEQRLQLKWLLSGATVFIVAAIGLVANASGGGWLDLITILCTIGLMALPVSIGFGILKFRLYDIDRIISRTLAYAIVTGLLVAMYAGVVLLVTGVLRVHGSVAVAVATLAAAALFTPVRRRVQRAVDHRFNRARYDAERTVTAFAARLQDNIELDVVRADLLGVVNGALEPTQIALWTTPAKLPQAGGGHCLATRVSTS